MISSRKPISSQRPLSLFWVKRLNDTPIPGAVEIRQARDQRDIARDVHQRMFQHEVQQQRARGADHGDLFQCAASQLSAARASTTSGTEISTAGSAAFAITSAISLRAFSTSFSGASKINS